MFIECLKVEMRNKNERQIIEKENSNLQEWERSKNWVIKTIQKESFCGWNKIHLNTKSQDFHSIDKAAQSGGKS